LEGITGTLGAITGTTASSDQLHQLRQSPQAPPLERYQVSFWARKSGASSVRVNYLPEAGQPVGAPFLRFDIPRDGLVSTPDEGHLGRRDSVLITLTIDPVTFSVDFQPSGVTFSKRLPASLSIWYGNADPDMNGDGVVDSADQTVAGQLALWTRDVSQSSWLQLFSGIDPVEPVVFSTLFHFSEYTVSW
jgi:hypothetical protein